MKISEDAIDFINQRYKKNSALILLIYDSKTQG
jgi:hypothetical protein